MTNDSCEPILRSCRKAALLLGVLFSGAIHAQAGAFDGYWFPIFHEDIEERIGGPFSGDYTGIPLSEASRVRADTWDPGMLTIPEHQCKPHASYYGFRAVGGMRMWHERHLATQEVVSINTRQQWAGGPERQIWMDGRPHPSPMTPHTWQGFSTGTWEGANLVVKTTHLKSYYLRRNGVFVSDRATMTDRFHRHGDVMTHIYIVEDPVYLTEPFVRTNGYRFNPNGAMTPYPCRYAIEIPRPWGVIPHRELGDQQPSKEFAAQFNLPFEAARGGAETTLPEFMKGRRPSIPAR